MSRIEIHPGGGEVSAPLTLKHHMSRICRHIDLQGKRVLDCGCGKGHYVIALLEQGADAWGIEYEASKVAEYKQLHPDLGGRVSQGDIEKMEYPDESFDIALLHEVLDHVPDDNAALREIHRILKPGGSIILFTPNRLHPFERHGVYLKRTKILVHRYVPFIPYVPVPVGKIFFTYWARNYWPRELRKMVTSAGFKITETDYIWPLYEMVPGKRQPAWLPFVKKTASALSLLGEKLPLVRVFGTSQYIQAVKEG